MDHLFLVQRIDGVKGLGDIRTAGQKKSHRALVQARGESVQQKTNSAGCLEPFKSIVCSNLSGPTVITGFTKIIKARMLRSRAQCTGL